MYVKTISGHEFVFAFLCRAVLHRNTPISCWRTAYQGMMELAGPTGQQEARAIMAAVVRDWCWQTRTARISGGPASNIPVDHFWVCQCAFIYFGNGGFGRKFWNFMQVLLLIVL